MTKWELFKAWMDREVLLMRRNLSSKIVNSTQVTCFSCICYTTCRINILKCWLLPFFRILFPLLQLIIVAFITMTTYIRTRMDVDSKHSNYYMGCMFFGIMRIVTNGIIELYMTLPRLAVFYKERDFNFYPAWACAIPASLIKIPFSLVDAFLWTAPTYYVVGFSPEVERWEHKENLYSLSPPPKRRKKKAF